MSPPFMLDPRLAAASVWISDLPLCQARLQNDARFAWIVLVPRRGECVELGDLDPDARAVLMSELIAAGEAVRAVGAGLGEPVERLNHGQLGLVVPQLHFHVVGRRALDAAWPHPVWSHGERQSYDPEKLRKAVEAAEVVFASRL